MLVELEGDGDMVTATAIEAGKRLRTVRGAPADVAAGLDLLAELMRRGDGELGALPEQQLQPVVLPGVRGARIKREDRLERTLGVTEEVTGDDDTRPSGVLRVGRHSESGCYRSPAAKR